MARAALYPQFQSLPELTAEILCEISLENGVDFATTLLYDRVKRSQQHSSFIRQIEHPQSWTPKSFPTNMIVLVVPAAFYKENPNSGADGKLIIEEANRLGLRIKLVPVSSTGTLEENAATLLECLSAHGHEEIILVSLCKGGADVKFALSLPKAQEHFRTVSNWINICGTLNGSPVAKWLLSSKPRFFLAWLYCKCRGHDLAFIRELQPSVQGSLSTLLKLPDSMRLINIVGFPLKRHLTNRFMRLCYQRVASYGPTDGGLLLADACSLPGLLYPLWGADHYLRPESRARQIISTILKYLTTADRKETLCLPGEIPAIDQIAQTSSA
jgi:hypothetical protein